MIWTSKMAQEQANTELISFTMCISCLWSFLIFNKSNLTLTRASIPYPWTWPWQAFKHTFKHEQKEEWERLIKSMDACN